LQQTCTSATTARDRARTLMVTRARRSTRAPQPRPARRPRLRAHHRFLTAPSHWQALHAGGILELGRGAWRAAVARVRPGLRTESAAVARPRCTSADQIRRVRFERSFDSEPAPRQSSDTNVRQNDLPASTAYPVPTQQTSPASTATHAPTQRTLTK
jgi:hypothetical protein